MKSVRKRLAINFMLIILITVIILEVFLITTIKRYYYNSVEDVLTNQIKLSSDFYSKYFSNNSLENNVLNNIDVFWKQTSAQVQIIDKNGNILMDSIGFIQSDPINDSAFKESLKGKCSKWIGKVEYSTSPVLSVSYPLKANGTIVGVLRFITSLRAVNKQIQDISVIFLSIGGIAVLISGIVSIFLSNTITEPIKELTKTAEKMASGNLKVRSSKRNDDEIGKLSDTLNYMADEILKKEQIKNEFISSVSHELRTPLTSIKGWAITLKTDELNDKNFIRDGLNIIEKESDRLTEMVEQLLDFSKFVSGKITLNKQKVQISNILYYIQNHIKPRCMKSNIHFYLNIEQHLPDISIDVNRIKQVLINLLDNSLNFTQDGGRITISAFKENEYITICVEDTGCGIAPNELDKVKEKFYKGKTSKSKNGIGLSVCDEIIKLHNGKFIIQSELNKGTTVFVKLPI